MQLLFVRLNITYTYRVHSTHFLPKYITKFTERSRNVHVLVLVDLSKLMSLVWVHTAYAS